MNLGLGTTRCGRQLSRLLMEVRKLPCSKVKTEVYRLLSEEWLKQETQTKGSFMRLFSVLFLSLILVSCSNREIETTHKTLEVVHFILSLPAKDRSQQQMVDDDYNYIPPNASGRYTEEIMIKLRILELEKEALILKQSLAQRKG